LNAEIKTRFFATFGNNDGDILYLTQNLGQICEFAKNGHELIIELGGKRIFVSHMPKEETIEAIADSGKFDIILSGHTHNVVNKKHNNVLILNPGELCGYLTNKSTFAIIDTKTMKAEIIEVK
jgi:putative phosphoesterase